MTAVLTPSSTRVVEGLFTEASSEADLNMGRIISDAFRMSGVYCPDCDYPQNAEEYERLLIRYIPACIHAHRAKIRYEHYGYRFMSFSNKTEHEAYLEMVRADQIMHDIRREMKPFAPCSHCRVRFNPTSRLRHGPQRFPSIKEFME